MALIHLTVVTPTEKIFEEDADRVLVRTTNGDVCILPKHMDYAATLGTGKAKIVVNGEGKEAEISGGLIYVAQDQVRILTNHFNWKE